MILIKGERWKQEAPMSLNRLPGFQSITPCHQLAGTRVTKDGGSSCSPHQITPRSICSLKSDEVGHFAILRPFWKKNGGSEFFFYFTIMFATSMYHKISIFIEIRQRWHFCDMAAILKKNGDSENFFVSIVMFNKPNTTCYI